MGSVKTTRIALGELLKHYKREEIKEAIKKASREREVAIKYGERGFGKRPDQILHREEVIELVKRGATSFHISEERWKNVAQLSTEMREKELTELRKGWDLVIDIDCNYLGYSQITADLLVKAIKQHQVEGLSCKFSGNHGFHLGIPAKAFPAQILNKPIENLFPEAPKRIAFYLSKMIEQRLKQRLLEEEPMIKIAERIGKKKEELVMDGELNPWKVLEIDTLLISSRHLYRAPYSFNEKSGLVSLPINPVKVIGFEKEQARASEIRVDERWDFLEERKVEEGEARSLILQAFDFSGEEEMEKLMEKRLQGRIKQKPIEITDKQGKKYAFEEIKEAIPEKYFPPCIKKMLQGIEDGRKRVLFVLTNFLKSVGWDKEMIEKRIKEWNQQNKEELREGLLISHLKYHLKRKEKVLPPNCANNSYYRELGFCSDEIKSTGLCRKIKNPVNYSLIRARIEKEQTKKRKKKDINKEKAEKEKKDKKRAIKDK